MARLSTSLNLPWKPDQVTIQGKNGYVINPKQVEYFKQLIKALITMYGDISNALNLNRSDMDALISNTAFSSAWNGVTDVAPSKDAVYDAIIATMPTGAIIAWLTATPPAGYLECDGAAVSRTTYAALFAVISDDYGAGDGSTTFNLPDFRGQFLRGWDHGSGTDPDAATRTDRGDTTDGDNVGTKQADAYQSHRHPVDQFSGDANDYLGGSTAAFGLNTDGDGGDLPNVVGSSGGNETRPININIMWCIKY